MSSTCRRTPQLTLLLCLCLTKALSGQSSVSLKVATQRQGRHQKIVLENRFLRLTLEPARGGRCSEFLVRKSGEQLIGKDDVSGMFIDHWAKYTWPSGLMNLPYKHQILRRKDQIGVRLSVQVPKMGGGKGSRNPEASRKMPTAAELIGLTVRKTIWLQQGSDVVRVVQEVVNTTKESRSAAIYLQQNLQMGGSHCFDNWYLPSRRGIEINRQPEKRGGRTVGPNWIQDPVAGWMAVKDRRSQNGVLFVFDYNYLRKTYTSGATGEWFMEPVPIGPGKSFRTEYLVKPVNRFRDFVHASSNLVADIQAKEIGKRQVQIDHEIAPFNANLNDLQLELQVAAWRSKKVLVRKSYRIERLEGKQRQRFTLTPSSLVDGIVVSVTASSGKWEERYEYFYAGDKAKQESRTNLFASQGGGLAGGRGTGYFRSAPRKRKTFNKPDFAKLPRRDPNRFRCLVVYGLFTHILNLDDAVAGWKHRGQSSVEFKMLNCPPNGVLGFPGTYDELFLYDVVVLSDVNYKALGDTAMEMICDYVQQGGSLLVVGGPYAYGNGEFQGSRFLDVLPVRLRGPFDLKWAGKGKSWRITKQVKQHRLLQGVSFKQSPRAFWHHFVTPKKGSTVVLNAGKQPTLITGRYGKGRVAALTLSPTGFAARGEVAWWDWNGWFPLVRNILSWLKDDQS